MIPSKFSMHSGLALVGQEGTVVVSFSKLLRVLLAFRRREFTELNTLYLCSSLSWECDGIETYPSFSGSIMVAWASDEGEYQGEGVTAEPHAGRLSGSFPKRLVPGRDGCVLLAELPRSATTKIEAAPAAGLSDQLASIL